MIRVVEARFSEGGFQLYDLSRHRVGEPLTPALTIASPVEPARLHGYAAHPRLRGVAYATETEVVRLDAAGDVRWRVDRCRPRMSGGSVAGSAATGTCCGCTYPTR